MGIGQTAVQSLLFERMQGSYYVREGSDYLGRLSNSHGVRAPETRIPPPLAQSAEVETYHDVHSHCVRF